MRYADNLIHELKWLKSWLRWRLLELLGGVDKEVHELSRHEDIKVIRELEWKISVYREMNKEFEKHLKKEIKMLKPILKALEKKK